jgi:hypothetical protein
MGYTRGIKLVRYSMYKRVTKWRCTVPTISCESNGI